MAKDTEGSRCGYGLALLTPAPPVSVDAYWVSVLMSVISQGIRHEAAVGTSAGAAKDAEGVVATRA